MALEYLDTQLQAIADKIREKNGTTDVILRSDFAEAINNITLPEAKSGFELYNNKSPTRLKSKAKKIKPYAFYYNEKLVSIELAEAVEIGNYAFAVEPSNSKTHPLKFIRLSKAEKICSDAFSYCCPKIMIIETSTVCILENNFLFTAAPKIYVPDDLVDQYKIATNWTIYQNNILPLSEYAKMEVA